MTMSAGRRRRRVQARAFFVPASKCQALPLACRALNAWDEWFLILIQHVVDLLKQGGR